MSFFGYPFSSFSFSFSSFCSCLYQWILSQEKTQGLKGVQGYKRRLFAHQEKRWPEITSCLDWKEAVQVIQQGGLSSAGDINMVTILKQVNK